MKSESNLDFRSLSIWQHMISIFYLVIPYLVTFGILNLCTRKAYGCIGILVLVANSFNLYQSSASSTIAELNDEKWPAKLLDKSQFLLNTFICVFLFKRVVPNKIWEYAISILKSQLTSTEEPQLLLHHRIWFTIQKFLPIIWPQTKIKLQIYLGVCLILLITGRVLNICVPWMNKNVVDTLTSPTTQTFPWKLIVACVLLGFSSKILDTIHSMFWSQIEQHNTCIVQITFFQHLHKLSHRWHSQNKTGDIFSIAEMGTEGLNNLLEHVLFSILPALIDIIISIIYLSTIFNVWIGLIVILQVISYLLVTICLMEWKKSFHRPMNQAFSAKHQYCIDSLLNFETVKYFTNEDYESEQMKGRIIDYQKKEYKVNTIGKIMDLVQVFVSTCGLTLTSLICGWMVYDGKCSVGDYFLFFSHFGQLHGLLKYFGSYYRSISRSLVNMEALMQILNENPEIGCKYKNGEIPKWLPTQIAGHIEFQHVCFKYENSKPILKNISFVLHPGQSLALVGPSGEGKSTILKLLFRFFEPTSGSILLDGRNIQDYPLQYLRKVIGIVPQDTILFNDTLRKNILYGNVNAGPEQIIEATKYACINDKCSSFPKNFETEVGERGFCLSGGEKLRITIARMFLKNSSIYLFDEVTSSLDSITEKSIMRHLLSLCKDKTNIFITHRLSTARNCDVIMVLENGEITESGTHAKLLGKNGTYAKMWAEQQTLEITTNE